VSGIGVRERQWAVRLALVAGVGILLGRLGPFDTFGELTSWQRYSYWIGLTLLMWLQGLAMLALIDSSLGRLGWPRWGRVVAAALLAAIPTAFEVAWAEMLLRVERDLGLFDIVAIFGDVALLSVPLLLLTHGWAQSAPVEASRKPVGSGSEALVALMEPKRRGPLLAVVSEDHYVRLYTDRGSQLVAMRFGDALAGLADAAGMQVHRRWWVAIEAVDTIARTGEGLQLRLSNDLNVPVSRSFAQQARKAWPDRLG
jgi:hypothetical protein